MGLDYREPRSREVHIFPFNSDRCISRRVSQRVFATLVQSDRVVGYTIPRSGPSIIIMAAGTTYNDGDKRFVARK